MYLYYQNDKNKHVFQEHTILV